MKKQPDLFVTDTWYFAALSGDIKTGDLIRVVIADEPITLGRKRDGAVFALRDICPHRAAPLSAGRMVDDTVECPYHGWKFGAMDGECKEIPALISDDKMPIERIKVRTFPAREDGQLIWVYISADKRFAGEPDHLPPQFDIASARPIMRDSLMLDCHVDHAVIGLMDPAHGPYVHKQWWWRSAKSMHEKSKAFEPREMGFAMAAHSPSSNSFAYKLLGGKPITEITFRLPGIRTELIKVGEKTLLSFTAVTPVSANKTKITQVFFSDMALIKALTPVLKIGAKKFLRQDGDMVDLQQMGLAYDPSLMLIEDCDVQAKWYHQIKKEWAASREQKRPFVNPVKARTLRWRS
jgi:phenylpropionate dioxygenase-like ring-hydroxylating dioxygenase large terminal subunit